MSTKFDCIIVGVGGMGSAALLSAAQKGWDVLGIEQFGPAHSYGSTHGQTRIIRRVYFEHPSYVPLCNRAFDHWKNIQSETDRRLLQETGLLQVGWPGRGIIEGVIRSAEEHDLELEQISTDACREKYPMFTIGDGQIGAYEKNAGMLFVEDCVQTMIDLATNHGAQTAFNSKIVSIESCGDQWNVETESSSYVADRLVICIGAWSPGWLPDLDPALDFEIQVLRKHQHWFDLPDLEQEPALPTYLLETEAGYFYGFPQVDDTGFKVAEHSGGDPIANPSSIDRSICQTDLNRVQAFLAEHVRSRAVHRDHSVCMYSLTPDQHFVVDSSRKHRNLVFATGMSGHGFKFAPVIGQYLIDLLEGKTDPDFEFLKADRF